MGLLVVSLHIANSTTKSVEGLGLSANLDVGPCGAVGVGPLPSRGRAQRFLMIAIPTHMQ